MNHPVSATPPVRPFSSARAHGTDGRRVPRLRSPSLVLLLMLAASSAPPVAAQQAADSNSSTTVVTGTVYDSLAAHPLEGALVQLAPSDLEGRILSGRTDSTGSFSIGGVGPGEYIVGFTHPSLDSLGLEVPAMKLTVTGGESVRLSLAIPSATSIRAQICPATSGADSSGLLLGFVRDADSGMHLDSGRVVLEWTAVQVSADGKSIIPERRSSVAEATRSGWYALCGVPSAGAVAARAQFGTNLTGYVDLHVPPRGVLHRDFNIPMGDAAVAIAPSDSGNEVPNGEVAQLRRGHSRLTGAVLDASGKPLDGARVLVWGSDETTSTDGDGKFSLAGLPAGTQTIEVRHIGYAPKRAAVELSSERIASVTVRLEKIADVLSEVTVYGEKSPFAWRLDGFRQRMRAGWGRFLTRTDIEKRNPLHFTDMLRQIPGIVVTPVGTFSYKLTSSRGDGCQPAIFLDGHEVVRPVHGAGGDIDDDDMASINDLVWMDNVIGIEVYANGMFAPAEYRPARGGSCPVILVWTSPDADVLQRAGSGSR